MRSHRADHLSVPAYLVLSGGRRRSTFCNATSVGPPVTNPPLLSTLPPQNKRPDQVAAVELLFPNNCLFRLSMAAPKAPPWAHETRKWGMNLAATPALPTTASAATTLRRLPPPPAGRRSAASAAHTFLGAAGRDGVGQHRGPPRTSVSVQRIPEKCRTCRKRKCHSTSASIDATLSHGTLNQLVASNLS